MEKNAGLSKARYSNQRSLLAGFILPWLTVGGNYSLERDVVVISIIVPFVFIFAWFSIAQELD